MLGNKAVDQVVPETRVAVIDVAAVLLVFFSVRFLRRPRDPKRAQSMVDQMADRFVGGDGIVERAQHWRTGGFIPLAMKDISVTSPSRSAYIVDRVSARRAADCPPPSTCWQCAVT